MNSLGLRDAEFQTITKIGKEKQAIEREKERERERACVRERERERYSL
jgi:hypothetical protein